MLRHGRRYQDIGSPLRQDIQNFHFSELLGSREHNRRPTGKTIKGG
jgi:hypothetical protein